MTSPIRERRSALGMTRADLGKLIGVSGRTVSYWESWSKIPDPGKVKHLQEVLGLTDMELWRIQHRPAPKLPKKERRSIW